MVEWINNTMYEGNALIMALYILRMPPWRCWQFSGQFSLKPEFYRLLNEQSQQNAEYLSNSSYFYSIQAAICYSLAYPYNRNTSNSNTIPVHTFTKTLTRMLVLNGYLTLRHETNQSIKMIIGYHWPRDRRLGWACEKCSSVASTGAGPGPLLLLLRSPALSPTQTSPAPAWPPSATHSKSG